MSLDDKFINLHTDIEILKKDSDQNKELFKRLDLAIEKIGDVSNNISKILSLHDHKVSMIENDISDMLETTQKTSEYYSILKNDLIHCTNKKHELADKLDKLYAKVDVHDEKINDLGKYVWVGGIFLSIIIFLVSNFEKLSKIFH